MNRDLYEHAYLAALASGMPKTAQDGSTARHLLGGALGWYLWPLVPAVAGGALLGAGLSHFNRRSDPTVADDNTKEDIRRVERLLRIQYYNDLARKTISGRKNKEDEDDD